MYSAGRMAPTRGCDPSRNSQQIASVVRDLNSTLYNRMNTFWPSNKGDNNWYIIFFAVYHWFKKLIQSK